MPGAMTMTKTRRQNDAISFPVLTYTDAEPRSDLREINGQHNFGQGEDVTQWQFPQPHGGLDVRSRKPPPGGIATFDFQLTAPPEEATPTSARSARSPIGLHTIGVALGSPGMASTDEILPPPRFNTAMFTQGQSSPRKSKWKKIGGLFKAKNALTQPTNSTEKEQLLKHKGPQKEEMTEEWPKIEIDPKQPSGNTTSPQRSRKFSLSGKKGSKEKEGNGRTSPILDVNIPDVHMERYSVMFSNVMTKNQKPSLLARRSKTLNNLQVPSARDFLSAKVPPVPQRRATSPARSSFTLFPSSQPVKAAQPLGTQNFSRGPTPLLRSNTLPVESPSRASASLEHPRFPHNNNSVSSFHSPAISNVFSERSNTPQSSSPFTNKEDKPLPAIKSEPPVSLPRSRVSSPQVPPKSTRPELKKINSTSENKTTEQKQQSIRQKEDRSVSQDQLAHASRPNLKLKTELPAPPPPAKDYSTPKSAPAIQNKGLGISSVTRIKSPEVVSYPISIAHMGTSPSKKASTVVTEREITGKSPDTYVKKVPAIEVSTARSISVSRGKRQMLVPIAARVDQLNPNERFVERRAMTPTITDVQYGHRHAVSQELQIESV